MSKTGLVLEGGGMRGIYTAGVLDVFMEKGLRFDGVIGVSAGAIHGCSFLSGQMGRSIRYYKKYCSDPRFMSMRSFITTGNVVGVDFCYHELPDKLDIYDHDAFLRNVKDTAFYATCTNVETGKPEYCRITDMRTQIDYLRASASLPYLSRLVEINGKKYLDGGCTDSIPVEAFRKMGYERNVVVLTRPADHVRKPEHKLMAGLMYRKYPAFVRALRSHHLRYNRTTRRIAELEREGSIFVIRPAESLNIGRLEKDPENIQRVYDIGRADGEKYMAQLEKWLGLNEKKDTVARDKK
ncbi:MAG: patatin family protein [Clostridia bacterium]|nr:patatin family protein [Clostridia bacterium]